MRGQEKSLLKLKMSPVGDLFGATGVSVYPETETETRVTDLSVSDGYLIMIRFWTWIV